MQNFYILPVYKFGIFNVKGFSSYLTLGWLAVALIACPQAEAQQFGLSVKPSSDSILVGNSLTYLITVTNLGVNLSDTFVTNVLSGPAQIKNATNYYNPGAGLVSNNVAWLELGSFPAGAVAQMTVTVLPTAAGSINNAVTVADPAEITNTASTNVVVQVTNVVADLGVTMTGPRQVVITNDWMTYGVSVTNAGPNAASSVMLTNTLPMGVIPIALTNRSGSSNFIYKLGTLAAGGYTNLFFTVEPINAGVLPFLASIGSGTPDTNTANNFASTNITVTNYLPGQLVAYTNSAQSTNFVLGLLEQTITVSNAGLSSVPAVRVVVTGLTNRLFNAVGTNNGNPFVYYSTALPTNQSAGLLLQYFPRKSFPFTNSQLHAFAVPVPNWTPPPVTTTSTNLTISRIVQLPNGNMLIEWPATLGKTYTVVYSDNVSFSNSMIAPPSVVAPANDVGWIDYGPPTTVSLPTNTARFYRVYQNP